jgi:hypothetical protein
MKLITFSLWGDNLKYTVGAIRNAELAPKIYPGWTCRYYIGQSTPDPIKWQLETFDHVEIVEMPTPGDWTGMFWRFYAAGEEDVEVMISRDTDCRLGNREKAAVDEWLKSDKGFHIMRDHPYHKFPVLGGMWGAKKDAIPNMKELIESWNQQDRYGTDYEFFAHAILPLVDNNTLIHDEFFGGSPFPAKRNNLEFVGEVFDENDHTVVEHSNALAYYFQQQGLL